MKQNKFFMNILLSSKEGEEDGDSKWIKKVFAKIKWGIIGTLIVWMFFPHFFPIHPVNGFWFVNGDIYDWIYTARYIFYWLIFLSIIKFLKGLGEPELEKPGNILRSGFWISLRAGVIEEIGFRWIIFLGSMIGIYITNWVLGGFFGKDYGLIYWFYSVVKAPISNFLTLGLLKDQLITNQFWYFGAAIVSANALFRDGHKYLGWFGYLNSWCIGMFLFHVMFVHGLFAAIVIHFLYDLLIFVLRSAVSLIKHSYGWVKY